MFERLATAENQPADKSKRNGHQRLEIVVFVIFYLQMCSGFFARFRSSVAREHAIQSTPSCRANCRSMNSYV